MQFTPALLLDLLAWNWPRAKKLAWWARQLVKEPAAETVARHVHNEVLRILRPAESMVRRMLLILALKEPLSPIFPASPAKAGVSGDSTPSPTHESPVLPAKAGTRAGAASQAQFLLTEPLTIRLPSDAMPVVKFGPRIFVFGSGMDWRPLPSEAPLPPLPAAPLLARLSRLDAVLAAPDAHAARLARLIARLRGAREAGRLTRLSPIRPRSLMPGRASRPLGELTRSAITYVCWGADAALDGAWDSG
ncbi:MAG: hypothetical protein V7651_01490 [Hyphomonas oceanitis]|uniref:hypothetical protein n=1 Tax=Hyphomonas oceanitis TaxID=81033 RepID=UPI003002879B